MNSPSTERRTASNFASLLSLQVQNSPPGFRTQKGASRHRPCRKLWNLHCSPAVADSRWTFPRNGELASLSGPGAVMLGRYTMFYLPGRGGYFFSTEPMGRRGLVQIGSVDRTNLQFSLENENYVVSKSPLL
jgi:hypothetical protein